ncbi:MAG TPA: phosphonate ABC transporter, permease protein PhnE [Verrucomicrobiae bacterium]|nr:phosphonate ABC transporter, permease protein PhnE [Verrucomicrobiae bacterium]
MAPLTRAPFSHSAWSRAAWLLLAAYVVYAASTLGFSWSRMAEGMGHGQAFIGRMFPPSYENSEAILRGLKESLEIAVLASFAGILIALPLGLLAARNLMPAAVSWTARAVIALARAFHPVILAIVFVKAIGFGAVAGVMALVVASIGFIGKLFAEAIEEISMKQVEAVRATGASFMNVIAFAVLPQVLPRFIGFATYQFDSNVRNSTMVGIMGAGGIGAPLFVAFQRFEYDAVCAIVLVIIGVVFACELVAGRVKKVFGA